MHTFKHIRFILIGLSLLGAGCRGFGTGGSPSLADNQCFYTVETEQFYCKKAQMLFSSSLDSGDYGYSLDAGTSVSLPKNKMVSLQEPGNSNPRKTYFLLLNRTGVYTLSEEESQAAVQQRTQNLIDERYE